MNDEDNVTYLTLEQIEEAPDVQEEDVDVPEWGGTVKVRGFTKDVEMALREEAKIPGSEPPEVDRRKLELLMAVHGIVEPPMTETQMGMLAKKSSAAVNRIMRVVMRLNGQTTEERDRREAAFREGSSAPLHVSPDGSAPEADEEESVASPV
jgi:hypothetical protein